MLLTSPFLPHGRRRRACAVVLGLAAAVCALAALPAFAEKADRNQPMNIEADQLRHDALQQTSVFTGRVVVTKGSIVLRGARLEVRQDDEGYQSAVVTGGGGQRAFFRQKRDTPAGAPEEFIEGEGETIEYSGKADTVRFVARAQLRRYRGGELSDEITGEVIVYNNLTDVFTVEGRKSGKSPGDGAEAGGRVRAILAPRDASPAAPAPGPNPDLKPSSRLEGPRR
ncbi:MAG: lipopolysaccharide transport periplasmic protein LptA [Burkholderiaceae bacterium]|jgi:lipopolysaccharide export system protein LptA|nr:lipopolysaccharide transport periplasmic protein LptA [Burkholderiaceae bacterium]MCO5109224.1 lipopolysaccharide transport periplasmic protein LptA [Burkholderiaceae bacterium]